MASKRSRDRGKADSASGVGAPQRLPSIGGDRPRAFANDNALDRRRRLGRIGRRALGWLVPIIAAAVLIAAWLG